MRRIVSVAFTCSPTLRRSLDGVRGAGAVNTTTPRAAGNGTGAQERRAMTTPGIPHGDTEDGFANIYREPVTRLLRYGVEPDEIGSVKERE